MNYLPLVISEEGIWWRMLAGERKKTENGIKKIIFC